MRRLIVLALALVCASSALAQWTPAPLQNAAVANSNGSPLDTSGFGSVVVTVNCATCSGGTTVNFEGTEDGANWTALTAHQLGTNTIASSTTTAGVTVWQTSVAGLTLVRARISGYSAGTVTVTAHGSGTSWAPKTVNSNAQIAGAAPSTGQGPVDTGTQRVFLGQKVTYYFASVATATAAGTAPFLSVCGSATKTVRIQQLIISGTVATAAVYGNVILTKTSTATSAGTPAALTAVRADSGDAASTVSLLNYYTALATAGTAVGKIASQVAVFPITGTVAAQNASIIFDWSNRQESKAPVLIGTAQCVEASFSATTTNAPTLAIQGWVTEE